MFGAAFTNAISSLWKKLNNTPGSPAIQPKGGEANKPVSESELGPNKTQPASVTVAPPVQADLPKPLRYLIASDAQVIGNNNEIIEVGYSAPRPMHGTGVRYCNLFNQTDKDYGPYLPTSDTAAAYGEKVVNPLGDGWQRLLADQCHSAIAAGFEIIEWDNPDGYGQVAVLGAVAYAASRGLKVLAKNPLACNWDVLPYIQHAAVVGIIAERDEAATPVLYDNLRKAVGKPDLPIWFVSFGDGKAWASKTAAAAANFRNMWTSYSPDGEYTSSQDVGISPVVMPIKAVPATISTSDAFGQCVKLVLVHEGGNDDDPRDPGGRTSRGIIQREYDTWRQAHSGLPSDVWQAPQQTILDIYQAKYWIPMRCADLPRGIDYVVFDYGVNSGISRGVKQLQTSLDVAVDGVIGPATLAAAKTVDPTAFIGRYQDARLAFLHGLGTWGTFGGGWGRRVSDVRRDALAMAKAAPAAVSESASATPVMLILRGINNLLDEPSSLAYASKRGYAGRILDVSGETGSTSPQVLTALREFRSNSGITALYGFSGGGYNLKWILNALTTTEKARIKLLVVLGAPNNPEATYQGPWELIYRTDPTGGHMDGPRALLNETAPLAPIIEPPKPALSADHPAVLDLGQRIKRTMLAKNYPWFDDQNVVSVEGMNPDGAPNKNRPNAFDDIKMVLNGDGKIIGGPWEGTTQPGVYWTTHPMASGGAFIIALGPQACWTPGDYHGDAWRQSEDSSIMGTRDPGCTYKRQGPPVKYGYLGIHHHQGYDLPNIANAAAGCQVIRFRSDQEDFMRITRQCPRYKADTKGYRLTATVLEAKDVLP